MRTKMNRVAVAGVAGLMLLASACGGDDKKDASTTVAETVAETVVETVPETVAETVAPSTDAPTTTAAAAAVPSDAMMQFAGEHGAELQAFGASVAVFAGEATTYLSDVSKAPSAAQAQADADALLAVLPERGTDPQLDLIRDVAENVTGGITAAAAGDQTTALAMLTAAQSQSEAFGALMTALAG